MMPWLLGPPNGLYNEAGSAKLIFFQAWHTCDDKAEPQTTGFFSKRPLAQHLLLAVSDFPQAFAEH